MSVSSVSELPEAPGMTRGQAGPQGHREANEIGRAPDAEDIVEVLVPGKSSPEDYAQ